MQIERRYEGFESTINQINLEYYENKRLKDLSDDLDKLERELKEAFSIYERGCRSQVSEKRKFK